MAQVAQKPAPKSPASKPLTSQASEEFSALKHQLNSIASWDMSPNSWDKIQIAYILTGTEQQARSFLAATALPIPKM